VVRLRAEDYEVLPAGIYAVRLVAVEARESDGGVYLRWLFEVEDAEFGGATLSAVSSARLTPKAKARQWAEVFLGRKLERGEEIDFDELIGRRALASVIATERNGATYNTVESLAPLRRTASVPF
jgi:hypothetical protein